MRNIKTNGKLLSLILGLSFGFTAYASTNEQPEFDKANVYKYLKNKDGKCLTEHLSCKSKDKSARQLSKGFGFVGTNYALDSWSTSLQLESSNAPSASVYKYSGATGTYTAKHYPVAIEDGVTGQYTYFVYSGPVLADNEGEQMIAAASKTSPNSEVDNPNLFLRNYGSGNTHSNVIGIYVARYDHANDKVSSPLLVHAKWTDDPHDNAVINKDSSGNLYVLVAGRNTKRGAFLYKLNPKGSVDKEFNADNWNIEDLKLKSIQYTPDNSNVAASHSYALHNGYIGVTYPKLFWVEEGGYFRLIYTVYCRNQQNSTTACNANNTRQLWSARLDTNGNMSELTLLSAYEGHYAVANSTIDGKGIVIAFNWHRASQVDNRTNLYVLYSTNGGVSWKTSDGNTANTPFLTAGQLNTSRIVNYEQKRPERFVYVKDLHLAGTANSGTLDDLKPTILFVRSVEKYPAIDTDPEGNYNQDQHQMNISFRYAGSWYTREVTDELDHNFSSGSLLHIANNKYRVFFPGLKNADSYADTKAGGYSNGLAGGVFSHVDVTLAQDRIWVTNMQKSAQKKPRQVNYLSGLCEVNYIRTVHHGRANSRFSTIMSAANPQRFEPMSDSPNNHLPAAPMLFSSNQGELYKLPMKIALTASTHATSSVSRNVPLDCQPQQE